MILNKIKIFLKNKLQQNKVEYRAINIKEPPLDYLNINKQLKINEEKINSLEKEIQRQNEILDSYNHQLKTIFFDYELEPKGVVKYFQLLGWELIYFINNICSKYELNYWLDYGTLLGAIRHHGFIPWDDDLDIGMMRSDLKKLIKILDDEIKNHNLEDNIGWDIDIIVDNKWIRNYLKINYHTKSGIWIGLDVFPYDYLLEKSADTVELFGKNQSVFNKKLMDKIDRTQVEKEYFNLLNLTNEPSKHIIPGWDNVRGPKYVATYDFKIMETKEVFPLKTLTINNRVFKCPQNSDYYLKCIYGDYYELPKIIHHHDVIKNLHNKPKLETEHLVHFEKLKKINDLF